jgi:hypothetical protein
MAILLLLIKLLIPCQNDYYGLKAGVGLRRYHQGILTAGISGRDYSMGICLGYPSFILLHQFSPINPPASMKIGKKITDQNKIIPINCHTFILCRYPPYFYLFP